VRDRVEGEVVVSPKTAHKSDETIMLDGTRLDELERRLGLPVRALDFEGFARMVEGG
jgi:NifB/MoaA-like Fe-S oxidoreductase